MTTDKEVYICHNCFKIAPLNEHGRCTSCDSSAVTSVHQVKSMTPQAEARLETKFSQRTSEVIPNRWYHFVDKNFETVVSYMKAKNIEEALEYSLSPMCEWYRVGNGVDIRSEVFNHSQYIEWAKKLWPLTTEESVT